MENTDKHCAKRFKEIHLCCCRRKNFKTYGNLTRHIRWNTDKYMCTVCKCSTPIYNKFTRHYKIHHSNTVPPSINHIIYKPSLNHYVLYTTSKTFKRRRQHELSSPQTKSRPDNGEYSGQFCLFMPHPGI